jgi:hypothetical protein
MGGDELGDMLVHFKADLSDLDKGAEQAKRKLGEVDKSAKETGGGFKDLLKNAASFATGMAVFNVAGEAVGFLKDQLGGVFQESMDAQAGMALTNAVLKSTHDASGETAQSVADLAGNLSHLTKFSDDTVQSGENMLLTFTNIGRDVFPQATKTILDMSQALGQDATQSAMQLGKALNDPIAGSTALKRVGVALSQSQDDLIKHLMSTNNIAGAQGVILKELGREFGEAAEAAGKTFGGQMVIAGQYVADFKQTLGDGLMPVVTEFLGEVEKDGLPVLKNFSEWFTKEGTPALKGLSGEIGPLVRGIENFTGSLFDTIKKSGAFQSVLQTVKDTLPGVEQFVKNVADALANKLLPPVLDLIKNFSSWVDKSGLLTDVLGLLGGAVTTVADVLSPLIADLSNVFNWLSKNKPAADALKDAIYLLAGAFVVMKLDPLVAKVAGLADVFKRIGANAKGSAADVTVASAVEEADLTAVDTKAKAVNADMIAMGPAAAEGGAVAKAGLGGLLGTLGTIAGFATLLALPFFTASPSTKKVLFPDKKDQYQAPPGFWDFITHMGLATKQAQDFSDVMVQAKQHTKEVGDQIDRAWQDMESLGAYAESHNRILGDMLDPLDVTKADVKVQELKSHLDDLPMPVTLHILTPQVVTARQKVIEFKSHVDDLQGPVSVGVVTPQVAMARQKVIDLKSHIDDLHNFVALSIGTRSVDAAIGSVMYLKSQLDDLPSPTVSVPVASGGGGHARGYASGGFSPIGEPFMFNEQGPELGMAVPGGVQFLSHPQSMNMLGGGGDGEIHVHVHNYWDGEELSERVMTSAVSKIRLKGRHRR